MVEGLLGVVEGTHGVESFVVVSLDDFDVLQGAGGCPTGIVEGLDDI